MYFTLCMGPAIDATVMLPHAPKGCGEIFKDLAEEENVGGKGVNVARWLALRGAKVSCGGLLGEDNDRPFVRELEKYGIDDRLLRVPGATRRNEMIVWPGGSMKLNRPAFPGLYGKDGAGLLEDILARVSPIIPGEGVAVLSGSLPKAIPPDFYAEAVRRLKALGWAVALDASGEAMRLGLAAGPDLIKPNADECKDIVGFVPRAPDDFRRATAMLREHAAHVIISDGGQGAWFDGLFVAAPDVEVVDTTAAGDTLLAEFCWRISGTGAPDWTRLDQAASWAVAAGSAACTMAGGAPPPLGLVDTLAR